MNRRRSCLALLVAALAVSSVSADIVTCADGTRYTGVITGDTGTHLILRVGGAELFLSRSSIVSVQRAEPDEDRRMAEEWQTLDARYREESAQAERESPPVPEAPPMPVPPPEPEPAEDPALEEEAVVFPAQPPFASSAPPRATDPVTSRLSWERTVREAIFRKEVIPGMTPRQVRDAWGWPDLTHPVHGVGVYTDRWIYTRGDGRTIVYFNRGKVTSVGR